MGGVAIAAATVIGFAAIVTRVNDGVLPSAWLPIAFAGIAMFIVGVLDDRLQLSPLAKLVSSLIVGAFLVFSLARRPDNALPLTHTLVATIWFAGVGHAFNLLDNMDGLAAGVALVAAGFLAWLLGPSLGTPIVVLWSRCAGRWSAFSTGTARRRACSWVIAAASLSAPCSPVASLVPVLQERAAFPWTSMLVVVILVVPLFDTGFVLVLRRFAGRSATRGGTDHVSHRLVSLGFSERSAVRILYLLGVVGGLTAWALVTGGIEQMIPVAALFAVLVTLIGIYLARVPAYNAQDFEALERSAFAPLLKDLTFRWHAGQVMLDLVLITACYYSRTGCDSRARNSLISSHTSPRRCRSCSAASSRRCTARGCISDRGRHSACATWRSWCAACSWARCCPCSRPPISTASKGSRASYSSSTRSCFSLPSSQRAPRSAA